MTLIHASNSPAVSPPLEWKLSQVFGDKLPGEDVHDVDVISAIDFDQSGDHIAVGDGGGRVIIFEKTGGKDDFGDLSQSSRFHLEKLDGAIPDFPKYHYKTEFQSHAPEFDSLKSIDIGEKINKVRWCAAPNRSLSILSANDKTIKLWKVMEQKNHTLKGIKLSQSIISENALLAEKSFNDGETPDPFDAHSPELTRNTENEASSSDDGNCDIVYLEDSSVSRCRRVYAHAHEFSINAISVNSDWETFLSSDDLRINLWNVEVSNQCFNIIDMKPAVMEDLVEVITGAEFHPSHCNVLAYSSSRGFIRIVDLRKSALCDHSATILKDLTHGPKSFFTEIINSITDMKFANDGRHFISRDFMNLKLWDMHMNAGPVAIYKIHESLRPKLSDLYDNDTIFDKFECCLSRDKLTFATGSYSNQVRVFSYGSGNEAGVTIDATTNTNRKPYARTTTRARRRPSLGNLARGFYRQGHDNHSTGITETASASSYDVNSKLLHLAWHPSTNLIAFAAGNRLLTYHA